MTYNVFSGTLNPTQAINMRSCIRRFWRAMRSRDKSAR